MKLLALDSTAVAASCAILEDGVLKGEFFINTKLTHSQTLMPMVQALLQNTCISPEEIDVFAVAAGPGSFTGVRIGVAAVKGMAMAADKPCVSVSALEAMAYLLTSCDCYVCAVMDARCNQVYQAMFEIKNGEVHRLYGDRAIAIDDLKEELKKESGFQKKPFFLVGDGASLCYNRISSEFPFVKCAPTHLLYQHASGVALAAFERYPAGCVSAGELLPVYLRLPQAQRELLKRKQ